MVLVTRISGKCGLHAVYVLVFGQSAAFMMSIVWFLSEARSSCCLRFGFRAKCGLHDVYGLVFERGAVFMMSMAWVSGKEQSS
jgi:hypothetical protein